MDRVETAFRKFDIDGDGFVDWEEFKEMAKNMEPEQAKRIFNSCDKVRHVIQGATIPVYPKGAPE